MIRPEMIPDKVVKAALLTDERFGMRTVIAAALAAWPDGTVSKFEWGKAFINLPLPTENSDE